MYFPKNVMDLIFSFDPTYKIIFDDCIKQFKKNMLLRNDKLHWILLDTNGFIYGPKRRFLYNMLINIEKLTN